MKRFRTMNKVEQRRYDGFKQYVKDNYVYLSSLDIAQLNREWERPITLQQCIQINKELFGE